MFPLTECEVPFGQKVWVAIWARNKWFQWNIPSGYTSFLSPTSKTETLICMKIIALKTDLTGICFLLDIPQPKGEVVDRQKDVRKKPGHGTLISLESQKHSPMVCKSNW